MGNVIECPGHSLTPSNNNVFIKICAINVLEIEIFDLLIKLFLMLESLKCVLGALVNKTC